MYVLKIGNDTLKFLPLTGRIYFPISLIWAVLIILVIKWNVAEVTWPSEHWPQESSQFLFLHFLEFCNLFVKNPGLAS